MRKGNFRNMEFIGRGNLRYLIRVANNEFGNRCKTCDRHIAKDQIAVFDPKGYGTMWHTTDECYPDIPRYERPHDPNPVCVICFRPLASFMVEAGIRTCNRCHFGF